MKTPLKGNELHRLNVNISTIISSSGEADFMLSEGKVHDKRLCSVVTVKCIKKK